MNTRNHYYSKKISYYRGYEPEVESEDYHKGREFENFVVSKFSRNYFNLIEWRSDKHYDGIYPQSSSLPDMVWTYESDYCTISFAVECKWRHDFYNHQIQLAKDYQLHTYRAFQHEERMRVFVILGIGGQPINPAYVYIIPLDHIAGPNLEKSYLNGYRRYNPSANFFLEVDNCKLT